MLPVTQLSIPDSASVSDTIQILASTEAPNGCWRDLFFAFDSISDTSYSIAAYGTYDRQS
ncbi:MAG: hypothetical protein R6U21_03880 [Thermoplasmatota archaeon]